jgi:PhnB protein
MQQRNAKTEETVSEQVKPIPDGYPVLTPYLIVRGAASAIDFYQRVFGAQERLRMAGPDGKVGHAELEFGSSLLMLADENEGMGYVSPQSLNGTPVWLTLYVEDVDAVFARAVAAGASVREPLEDKFYGDRAASVADPFGHVWSLMTHVEDVSPDEMQRRAATFATAAATP